MRFSLSLVLVRTMYPTNVGSVSRVMGNMGAERLILIDPRCDINSKARQGAAGAQKYLASRIVYASWDDFYTNEPNGIRIGLTRREGKSRSSMPLKNILEELSLESEKTDLKKIYLILGPEDDGLSSDDVAHLNFCATLPCHGDYPSMNLSHAALLGSYLVMDWISLLNTPEIAASDSSAVEVNTAQTEPIDPFNFPEDTIKQWLETMGFDLSKRRASSFVTLRRILLRNLPSPSDLRVLEAILQQNIRKLKQLDKTGK